MVKERLKKIINQRIEELASAEEGTLTICGFPHCKRIAIPLKKRVYWMSRDENPEGYGKVLDNYAELVVVDSDEGFGKDIKRGLSHGYCPEDFKNFFDE